MVVLLGALLLVPSCRGWEWAWGDDETLPTDWSLRLVGTQTCPTPPHERLEPGTTQLGVEVELRAGRGQILPANYFYATLEGPHRSIQAELHGCEPVLSGPPLREGQSTRGYLNFVIPTGIRPLELVYSPALALTNRSATDELDSPDDEAASPSAVLQSKRLTISPDATSSSTATVTPGAPAPP